MKQAVLHIALITAVLVLAGCKDEGTVIEGRWRIDMEPMLEQAKSLGASGKEVQKIEETFIDGRMNIDSERITLTIPGYPDSEIFQYTLLSKQGGCLNMKIHPANRVLKYCVEGSRLEVHDPTTKLVAVYSKA